MQLNVLTNGEIGDPAGVALRQLSNRAQLMREQMTIGNANAHHEIRRAAPLAAFTADCPYAIALRIHTPRTKVSAQPLRRDRVEALAGERANFIESLPGIFLAFE